MREDKENLIVKLTFDFALQILKCTRELQRSHDYSLADQLLRSGILIGRNVREAQNAESKADFIHKMKIAAKDETFEFNDHGDLWLKVPGDRYYPLSSMQKQ